MAVVAFVTAVIVTEYLVFTMLTGRARVKFGVEAPAVSGHPVFERYYRVQQNTLEQLAIVLPSLWLFASYVSPKIGAILGLVFVVGRALYMTGYVSDPSKRGTGFLIGFVATAALLLGALLGTLGAIF